MIEELSIRDLGVISDARLVFSSGLTALTGETGAGKTMVLTALGLLLGERADSTFVRSGSGASFVEGRWFLSDSSPSSSATRRIVAEKLDEAGIPFADGELVMNRTVSLEGRSKATLNARAMPVTGIAELSESLVVIHGQADQIRLKSPAAQREALDSFAGVEHLGNLAELASTYAELGDVQKRYEALSSASSERSAEVFELKSAVGALESLKPMPGEYSQLGVLATRLSNVEAMRAVVGSAHDAIAGADHSDAVFAMGLLGQARKGLETIAADDAELLAAAERMRDLGYQLTDLATDLARYLSELESDSELSLDTIQERRAALAAAGRQFATDPDRLDVLVAQFSDRLLEIDDSDVALEGLAQNVEALKGRALGLAALISDSRRTAAHELAELVSIELAGLAMPNSRLLVDVTQDGELRAHGSDTVAFRLASHAGAEARPLGRGASGGELSRIMLAIEVVLARNVQTPTFIFDEVDAGVGGEAAIEVGRRLARLAQRSQVIVVTHLAQVAAFADRQLRVLKSHSGEVTSSDVVAVEGEPRIAELARMISGMADSEAARKNAQELLALARQTV